MEHSEVEQLLARDIHEQQDRGINVAKIIVTQSTWDELYQTPEHARDDLKPGEYMGIPLEVGTVKDGEPFVLVREASNRP